MDFKWVSLVCAVPLVLIQWVHCDEDARKCGPAPTPFELMRDPFYATDLEDIIEREFGRKVTVGVMQRDELRKMYGDMMKRAQHSRDIVNILEDIKTVWKQRLWDWQMSGCLGELMREHEGHEEL